MTARNFFSKIFFFNVFFILVMHYSNAQISRLSNNYFLNYAIYNPSFVGSDGYFQIHLNNRQQWKGIDGAPMTTSLFAEVPFRRLSLGVNVFNEQNGIFNFNSLQTSLAYLVPFNQDHGIRFGLSVGATMNSVDMDELNPADPATNALLETVINLNSDFGFSYYYKNLNIGFTMTDIFDRVLTDSVSFGSLTPMLSKNYIGLLKYKFSFADDRHSFEPSVLFRTYQNGPDQFEGTGIFNFNNLVWVGGTYRQDYGVIALAGFNIKDKFKFGYAHELATKQVSGFMNSTHEFHISLRFGSKKERFITNAKKEEKEEEDEVVAVKEYEEPEPDKTVTDENTDTGQTYDYTETGRDDISNRNTPIVAPVETDKEETTTFDDFDEFDFSPVKKEEKIPEYASERNVNVDGRGLKPVILKRGNHILEMPKGHYVIIGAFRYHENAENYSDYIFNKGYDNNYGFNSEAGLFYVIYYKGKTPSETRQVRDEIRKNRLFSDAWYLMVEE